MVISLFLGSMLGIEQERLFARYGRHTAEAVFYTHFLTLPAFYFMRGDISAAAADFSASAPMHELVPFPRLWVLVAICAVSQYVCIANVYRLVVATSALTLTMVLTVRKVISLTLSTLYFGGVFSVAHTIGAALVLGGSVRYAMLSPTKRDPAAKDRQAKGKQAKDINSSSSSSTNTNISSSSSISAAQEENLLRKRTAKT